MNFQKISEDVFYVGVNDRTTHLFEGMWPLPYGVSYNSYIVKGDYLALIDTVHAAQGTKYLSMVEKAAHDRPISYLVINHMEPDHSGSIRTIVNRYPGIKIIGNSKTAAMIKAYYGIDDEHLKIVADGDTLDLGGGKELKFVLTPMVHWPETMMTYYNSPNCGGVLFSGDAFGCFGALNGGIIDSHINTATYYPEMYRYYAGIVAKYGQFVQKAMARFDGMKIDYICSTHGPVWHDEVGEVAGIYSRLSRFDAAQGVVVAYASMYGNTEDLAEAIAAELSHCGVRDIKVHNLSTSHLSYVLADIMRYKGLIIGGPTYCNGIYPEVDHLLTALKTRELRNRYVGCFGSGTWAPVSSKNIRARLEEIKGVEITGEPFDMKCAATDADIEHCRQLATAIAAKVLE